MNTVKVTLSQIGRFTCPWLLGLAIVAGVLLLPSLASASVAQEEQAGSRLLDRLESGKLRCAEASASDFDHIGEYVMGRMLSSPRGHEAMNRVMSSMMGAAGEQIMHEAMGRRFAGCGSGRLPAGFGRMMGAFNAMGMMGGGMMGGGPWTGPRSHGGSGSMMGGYWSGGTHDSSDWPWAAIVATLVALVLGMALLLAWFVLRGRPRRPRSDGEAAVP